MGEVRAHSCVMTQCVGSKHDGSWLETVAATPVKLWMDADLQARFDGALAQKTFGQLQVETTSLGSTKLISIKL